MLTNSLTAAELGGNPSVRLSEDFHSVVILDQTLLPNETLRLTLNAADALREAIASLRVRGAPAIGIFAAYALYVLAEQAAAAAQGFDAFYAAFSRHRAYLAAARPTAVNLAAMLGRMDGVARANRERPLPEVLLALRDAAFAIHREDIAMCRAIAEHGLTLVKPGDGILTHCNAGELATSRYGTGLGPILLARERGIPLRVYCDETRPLLQGARLTAYELTRAGADVTLICDSMASLVMREGKINAVFVGCDRVAANGDTANKIGTSGAAILARHYGIPFYVCCPTPTIDMTCATGADIPIELRDPEEIRTLFYAKPAAPEGVKCYNPAFDVTDAPLITAIITERGILRAPYTESLQRVSGV
ncbi:MAG: S-methyl-5-thioribose-1-phosphate isomerase [Oscillospiraceae bacterium]|jgi:methylthioribose-1-phosphate isomerase|nr:S-methyl-5-thioribose-1-phosphate isomerase [Oscillospiraceae bacterium]